MSKPGDGFDGISAAVARRVSKIMFTAGQTIQIEAQHSITAGSTGGKYHVPSKPGEPPNEDTGTLAAHIETVQTGPLEVQVSSSAPYSAPLEFGTVKMAARPFMKPAVERSRKQVLELIRRAADEALKGKDK